VSCIEFLLRRKVAKINNPKGKKKSNSYMNFYKSKICIPTDIQAYDINKRNIVQDGDPFRIQMSQAHTCASICYAQSRWQCWYYTKWGQYSVAWHYWLGWGTCQYKSWHRSLEQQCHYSRDNNLLSDDGSTTGRRLPFPVQCSLNRRKSPHDHDPSLKCWNLLISDNNWLSSSLGCHLSEGKKLLYINISYLAH